MDELKVDFFDPARHGLPRTTSSKVKRTRRELGVKLPVTDKAENRRG